MKVLGETKIFKDDKGIYRLSIANKERNENGEDESIFMRVHVGFRKGQEVKNKSKINIKDGFLTFFQVDTGEKYDNGNPIYKKFPKIMVMDYELLEEGVDEVYQSKDYSNNTQSTINGSDIKNGNVSTSFMSDDDLPF